MARLYVTGIDKWTSAWGPSRGKRTILVFECDTQQDADAVTANMKARDDIKRVSVATTRPRQRAGVVLVVKDKAIAPAWYETPRLILEITAEELRELAAAAGSKAEDLAELGDGDGDGDGRVQRRIEVLEGLESRIAELLKSAKV